MLTFIWLEFLNNIIIISYIFITNVALQIVDDLIWWRKISRTIETEYFVESFTYVF